jgi:hypothetical protein
MKKNKKFLILFFIIFLTRFLFPLKTARFIWDEGSDLRRMHKMTTEKFFTVIGPISEDSVKHFGSLTYYLSLPTTVFFNFSPIGPILANAIFGFLMILILFFIFKKLIGETAYKATLAISTWPVFLSSSRSAWNPYFMPFWAALSLFFWIVPTKLNWFLSGLFIGLTINHHWLGALTVFSLLLISFWRLKREEKKENLILFFILGVFISLFPFIVFDLRHEFFFTNQFFFSQNSTSLPFFSLPNFLSLKSLFSESFSYLLFFFSPLLVLFLKDKEKVKTTKKKDLSIYFFLVFLLNLLLCIFLTRFYFYYLLAGTVFLVCFVGLRLKPFLDKKIVGLAFSVSLFFLGIIFYILDLPPKWQRSAEQAEIISQIIIEDSIAFKNVNVAAIQSPDINLTADRYRDLANIKNANILSKDQYKETEVLYVISTSFEREKICHDEAYEVQSIRPFLIKRVWKIGNGWYLYRLEKTKSSKGAC